MYLSRLSLVEVLVAVAILTIALLGLFSSILNSMYLDQDNQELMIVSYALRKKVEELRAFARTNFDDIYQEYGPGSAKEFFPIYLNPSETEANTKAEFFPPKDFRTSPNGHWLHAGRIKIVVNETVTAPDLPMVFDTGNLPPIFETTGSSPLGNSDVSVLLNSSSSSDSVKVWYIVVTAVWESSHLRSKRSLSYQTFISDRLKDF